MAEYIISFVIFCMIAFIMIGIFAGDTIYATAAMCVVIFGGLLLMIWYHGRLKKKYLILCNKK